jgi:formate dehydrogenase major subunit
MALEQLEFLVVQELFLTDTARAAHVVLPASSFLEKAGTFTNGERRVQKVNPVVTPRPGTKPDGLNCDEQILKLFPQAERTP